MSKHTPGPWEIQEHPNGIYKYISGPEHLEFAQVVWCMEDDERSPECEANARLIAAAPELLEAVEELLACTEGQAIYNFMEPQKKKARAAIAKAKGEEQ